MGILAVEASAAADRLRDATALWWLVCPSTCLALGAGFGVTVGGIAARRAHAPFLAALPLAPAEVGAADHEVDHVEALKPESAQDRWVAWWDISVP